MKNNNKKKTSILKAVILIVVIVVLATVSLGAAFLQFYKPAVDGDTLPFVPDTVEHPEDGEGENPAETGDEPNSDEETTAPKPKPSDQKYKQQDGVYNFLLLGYDRVGLNTDVIMIANFNVKTGSVSIMQIPRDTYLDGHRANAVYGSMYSKYKKTSDDPYLDALKDFEVLLEQNLCINIQNSAIIDLEGFIKIVDLLGGVEVDVPKDMSYSDPYQNLTINLKKGTQLLSGKQAEGLVRFRDTYKNADISRLDVQKNFLSAFIKKIKTMSVTTMPSFVREIIGSTTTDMSTQDCLYFLKEAAGIDLGSVVMMTFPTSPEISYVVANRALALDMINSHFNVYDTKISDTIFDRNRVFTDASRNSIHRLYTMAPENYQGYSYDEHSAQELIDTPIKPY